MQSVTLSQGVGVAVGVAVGGTGVGVSVGGTGVGVSVGDCGSSSCTGGSGVSVGGTGVGVSVGGCGSSSCTGVAVGGTGVGDESSLNLARICWMSAVESGVDVGVGGSEIEFDPRGSEITSTAPTSSTRGVKYSRMAGRSLPISLRRKIRKRSRRSKNIRLSFLRFLRFSATSFSRMPCPYSELGFDRV